MYLDHITIRTRDLPGTRAFFLKVFDELEERPRPKAIHRIPGHWLYADDKPMVHLIGTRGYGMDSAAEAFDHVGIHLNGYSDFRAKLETLEIPYSTMDLPELDERRLFLHTPSGPLIETVFHEPISDTQEQIR
ncbi:glyoxalase [uncultured Roseobacter sp.]|uniref:glyoxalase n=1 Tax=uncultured Roseobacter sp. TaxID=114847 RepID=UPI0026152269|nr:glyoxalase [uncultured Roseobacter sp.]